MSASLTDEDAILAEIAAERARRVEEDVIAHSDLTPLRLAELRESCRRKAELEERASRQVRVVRACPLCGRMAKHRNCQRCPECGVRYEEELREVAVSGGMTERRER